MKWLKTLARRKWFRVVIITTGIWIIVCGVLAVMLVIAGDRSDAEKSDVIIVLGSGLRRDGRAGDALYRRSVWAARAYLDGYAPAVLCTGGVSPNQTRSEAEVCRELVIGEGVPPEAVFLEDASHSTEQNAINARTIMDERGWQSSVIVTDAFHMLRANWIFDTYDIPHTRHPVPRTWVRWTWYSAGAAREIVALHWFLVKEALNLPQTDFIF